MTQDAFTLLSGALAQLFRLFNSWYLPGTHVTPLSLLLLAAFSTFLISFIRKTTNQSGGAGSVARFFSRRSDK